MPPNKPTAPSNSTVSAAGPAEEDSRTTIERLEQELIACQRLAMLGNLAGMAAHEFRNLMSPLVTRCDAALSMDDDAFMRKSVERALTQAQRAIRVTGHLLDFAHDNEAAVEACSVADAVQEAIDTMTRPLDKDGIAVHIAVPADVRVQAQPDLLCQILLNLLLNARTAMTESRGPLSVQAQPNGDAVDIAVRDSGVGLDPDHIENVLNPFLAADPYARPTDWQEIGLGLSVCRLIAHKHGARIWAEPNDGPGCTFQLRWPKA